MLDTELIEEGTPGLDGALAESTTPDEVEVEIEKTEVGAMEIEGLTKELPLLATEGALEDERLDGPVLWLVTTLVAFPRPAGLVVTPVTKPVEGDPMTGEPIVSLTDTLIGGIWEPVGPKL